MAPAFPFLIGEAEQEQPPAWSKDGRQPKSSNGSSTGTTLFRTLVRKKSQSLLGCFAGSRDRRVPFGRRLIEIRPGVEEEDEGQVSETAESEAGHRGNKPFKAMGRGSVQDKPELLKEDWHSSFCCHITKPNEAIQQQFAIYVNERFIQGRWLQPQQVPDLLLPFRTKRNAG